MFPTTSGRVVRVSAGKTALLTVPSVIIDEEDNVLVNPAHPDSLRVVATMVRRFVYDHRAKRWSSTVRRPRDALGTQPLTGRPDSSACQVY